MAPGIKHRVYVMEEGNWCIKGKYEDVVVDEDEEVEWTMLNGEHTLIMRIVSFYLQSEI